MKYLVSLLAVACLLQQGMADSKNLVAKASNTFSNSLYEKVAKEPGNVLVCPISLHVALGLVLQGAGSNTSTELASVLGFSEVNDGIKESYKSLLTGIKDNTLKIATKLYPAANYQLSSSYVSIAQQYFLSDVEGVDYSKPTEASNKINKYVEEHTNNKIHDLISPDAISDMTRLIIINAVHFQATWKKTFTTAYDDYFKVSPTEKVSTKMMSMTDYFHYKEDSALDAKVLKMDYTDAGYSMVFILPNKEDGLPALEEKLVHTELDNLLKDLHERKVEVTIPKFKLEKTINLKDILISMGIKDVFSSRADLHGIANGDSLYVSDVIQKTFINVHENGTEAAAATGFLLELLSANTDTVTFSARWPFHFTLVRIQKPRMVLFDGRFARPSTDRHPQESNQFGHNSDEDVIHFSEDTSEKENTIINPGHRPEQQFQPDLLNNKVTTSDDNPYQSHIPMKSEQNSNSFYHQTQHSTTELYQSYTKDSDAKNPTTYTEHEPNQQSNKTKPVNKHSHVQHATELYQSNTTSPTIGHDHNQQSHNTKHSQIQYGTNTFNPTTAEDSDIKYPDYVMEKPSYQFHNNAPVNRNSNTTKSQLDKQQPNNNEKNNNLVSQKPHQHSPDNGNLDMSPEMQNISTQLDQPKAENNYEQNQSHNTQTPLHQTATKAFTENSNILPYTTPKSYQLSAEDYIRRNNEFAHQLQEFYQRYQIPTAIPFQRPY